MLDSTLSRKSAFEYGAELVNATPHLMAGIHRTAVALVAFS